ncbi:MAG: hypothetical protein VX498_14120 [Myxococcota bacterium]|nr:hypothetical protein [Myxococcota bacterium]
MKTSRRLAILGATAVVLTAAVAWERLAPASSDPSTMMATEAGLPEGAFAAGGGGHSPRSWRLREHKEALPEVSLAPSDIEMWTQFLKPSGDEANWSKIDWRDSMWDAILEARQTGKPLLVWSMNGHPQGFT